MTVEPSDTEVCGCGMKGCLERLVSLKRVRQMMKTSPPAKESPLYGLEESVSFSQIFSASSAQDRDARDACALPCGVLCIRSAQHLFDL